MKTYYDYNNWAFEQMIKYLQKLIDKRKESEKVKKELWDNRSLCPKNSSPDSFKLEIYDFGKAEMEKFNKQLEDINNDKRYIKT
jgi:hypothetical protein